MKTGEGKTLTIALAVSKSLTKKGVHIITVNDCWQKELLKIWEFKFLGLTAGYITDDQTDDDRKINYNCDITYATNSELGFDYLRDNMKFSFDSMVQRGHNFAIVDDWFLFNWWS